MSTFPVRLLRAEQKAGHREGLPASVLAALVVRTSWDAFICVARGGWFHGCYSV